MLSLYQQIPEFQKKPGQDYEDIVGGGGVLSSDISQEMLRGVSNHAIMGKSAIGDKVVSTSGGEKAIGAMTSALLQQNTNKNNR